MRYFLSPLLVLFLLLGPALLAGKDAPRKRPPGKQSSIGAVRKPQKLEIKPLVYSAKKNRPVMAKKPHWWQRR